ncbi:MAG: dCTP deaminase [Dehalococcoidales bacterium]|nr:dCTP deaminase [Dehalococcoidales bacterium]
MSVLSGKQILSMVEKGQIKIDNLDKNLIQGATVDLRLGAKILASPTSPEKLGMAVDLTKKSPDYEILSGQMVGVISLEKIFLPLDLCGRFGIRSSLARKGINAFGGVQLDPGFRGKLTMNLLNVGPEPISISLGEPLFSVEFSRLEEAATSGYSGEYQDQDDFPADQTNFILQAHTTSLAEIPTFRAEIRKLNVLMEQLLEEKATDPDEGLMLRDEIKQTLLKCHKSPEHFITASEMEKRLVVN